MLEKSRGDRKGLEVELLGKPLLCCGLREALTNAPSSTFFAL